MTTYYAAHIISPTVFRRFDSIKQMKETLKRVQNTFHKERRESRYMVYTSRPADHKPFRILIIPKMGEPSWTNSLVKGTWEQKAHAAQGRYFDMDILQPPEI